MRSRFHDSPAQEHANDIRVLDRRQPMRDRHRNPIALLRSLRDRLLHHALRQRIQCRGGLIQQQDARLPDQRACNRYALALSAREREASGPTKRAKAIGQRGDEVVGVGLAAGGEDCIVGYVFVGGFKADGDVLTYRALVKGGLLLDESEALPVSARREGTNIGVVEGDAAGCGIVEALEHGDHGGLAAAGGTDEGDELTGVDLWLVRLDYYL